MRTKVVPVVAAFLAVVSACAGGGAAGDETDTGGTALDAGSDAPADAARRDDVMAPLPDGAPGDAVETAMPDAAADSEANADALDVGTPDMAADAAQDDAADAAADAAPDAPDATADAADTTAPEDTAPPDTADAGDAGAPACWGSGLTWFQLSGPSEAGTLSVSCGDATGQCNPYNGDTPCTESRPVLCVQHTGAEAPAGESPWFPGQVGFTQPMQGCEMTSLAKVNAFCAQTFGEGWRMAEWHDGSPGNSGAGDVIGQYMFFAFGDWTTTDRFWVFINNQIGNCFPLPPSNCCPGGTPCPDESPCVQGFCSGSLPLPPGGCYEDADCPVGYSCDVATATAACEDGGFLDFGTCVPNGPGGMCPIPAGSMFGTCTDELGYMWTGADCSLVQGCDCGAACADILPTYDECVAACAPPVCCTSSEECGGSYICRQGFCVAPVNTPGACWFDEDCGSHEVCSGAPASVCGDLFSSGKKPKACKKGQWCPVAGSVVPGTCTYMPACCATNAECGPDEACALAPSGGGTCQPKLTGIECWTAADCEAGEGCAFAALCPCQLGCESQPGVCAPLPKACCTGDADCAAGDICTTAPSGVSGNPAVEIGQCVPALADKCFTTDHCGPDQVCADAGAWPCGTAGGVPYGSCIPAKNGCCISDANCPDGYQCRGLMGIESMSCQPDPAPGSCWSNSDCAAGLVCHGAYPGAGCGGEDTGAKPGACGPPKAECCVDDSECAEGRSCTAKPVPGAGDFPDATFGQCVLDPPGGMCLNNDDCPPEMACFGSPGWPCGKEPGPPGWCSYPNDSCCSNDAGCPQGTSCVGLQFGTVGQCSFPAPQGQCWGNSDCGPDQVCKGAYVCSPCLGCIWGLLETPGTCVAKQ